MKNLKLILTVCFISILFGCNDSKKDEERCFGFCYFKTKGVVEGESYPSDVDWISEIFEIECDKGESYLRNEVAYKFADFLMERKKPLLGLLKNREIEITIYGSPNYIVARDARLFVSSGAEELDTYYFDLKKPKKENAISELKNYLQPQKWKLDFNQLPEKLSK